MWNKHCTLVGCSEGARWALSRLGSRGGPARSAAPLRRAEVGVCWWRRVELHSLGFRWDINPHCLAWFNGEAVIEQLLCGLFLLREITSIYCIYIYIFEWWDDDYYYYYYYYYYTGSRSLVFVFCLVLRTRLDKYVRLVKISSRTELD